MKFKAFLILYVSFCLFCSCSNNNESSVITETSSQTTTKISLTETSLTETNIPTNEIVSEKLTEKNIVESVYIDLYGSYFGQTGTSTENEPYIVIENSEYVKYENELEHLLHKAETISKRYLGYISDEHNLTEKAREIFIDIVGEEYIEYAESDYIEVDGIKKKLERIYPYYNIKYYEEYDVWYICPNSPSGKTEDGKSFDVIWDFPPFLIVRGEDGKILAVQG